MHWDIELARGVLSVANEGIKGPGKYQARIEHSLQEKYAIDSVEHAHGEPAVNSPTKEEFFRHLWPNHFQTPIEGEHLKILQNFFS
jgi:hypothetical protein